MRLNSGGYSGVFVMFFLGIISWDMLMLKSSFFIQNAIGTFTERLFTTEKLGNAS